MFEEKNPAKTPLEQLGEFGLIERLTKHFPLTQKSSKTGVGDDAAVLEFREQQTVVSTDLLLEGIHFDLSYMPLKHLGYKAVVVNLSDIFAMNARPSQITVAFGVSNRFTVEALEELYSGIQHACNHFGVDLVGGDTTSSAQGLVLAVTAIGAAPKEKIVYRNGAKENELLVVSGDLGGAYAGLQILEREKEVFKVNPNSQPDLTAYSYSVGRQLKPEARADVIALLNELEIIPSAMIDVSDGLSSEILHLSKASNVGMALYEEKLPIDPEVVRICEEFKINPSTAVLNGGEDYELLFTVNQSAFEKIKQHPYLSIIGHCTDIKTGCNLITGLGQQLPLEAQGWTNFNASST